eukprot:1186024-Prorocentrum_lima.AAC.1
MPVGPADGGGPIHPKVPIGSGLVMDEEGAVVVGRHQHQVSQLDNGVGAEQSSARSASRAPEGFPVCVDRPT